MDYTPEDAVFEVMEAKPLPTSPNLAGANKNEGAVKLAMHLENVEQSNISVAFIPIEAEQDWSYEPEFVSLDEWRIPEGEIPYLTGLNIDSKKSEDFSYDKKNYFFINEDLKSISVISAESDFEVKITQPTAPLGVGIIEV